MNNIRKKTKTILREMPYISKVILFGGIAICTILFTAAYISAGNITGDFIDMQNAIATQRLIVEYYLVSVMVCFFFGFASHYIDAKS